MNTKQMYVANLNVVFGKDEEPLIDYVESLVLPALKSGIRRETDNRTSFIFEDVCIKEIEQEEYVLQGVLIKNTILDVMSEYTDDRGLEKTDKHYRTAPYSVFILYLRNHRMLLVKNQNGSPDVRSFTAAFRDILREYTKIENTHRKKEGQGLLPYAIVNSTGIKTAKNVKEALKDVDKIEKLILKFYPMNAEWDMNPMFEGIDQKIRKTIKSKSGRMIFNSPQSKEGVADIIESTEGIVKSELKVKYKSETSYLSNAPKRSSTIKDNEISDVMPIDVSSELDEAYDEINAYKHDIKSMSVQTQNHIIDYRRFLEKHKK